MCSHEHAYSRRTRLDGPHGTFETSLTHGRGRKEQLILSRRRQKVCSEMHCSAVVFNIRTFMQTLISQPPR